MSRYFTFDPETVNFLLNGILAKFVSFVNYCYSHFFLNRRWNCTLTFVFWQCAFHVFCPILLVFKIVLMTSLYFIFLLSSMFCYSNIIYFHVHSFKNHLHLSNYLCFVKVCKNWTHYATSATNRPVKKGKNWIYIIFTLN